VGQRRQPRLDGGVGRAHAVHVAHAEDDAAHVGLVRDAGRRELHHQREAHAVRGLSGLVGGGFGAPRTTTCLYTLTSDRDFVCDRVPGIPQISVGLGAAHGFKFASWFGRELAALATGAPVRPELAPFSMERESLYVPISREAWFV
jgi:glycine/D-amino acid oxidase-like deaminating enzyme